MKKWSDQDGVTFSNSEVCFGKEFKPKDSNAIDIAKISIRGQFPETGWGYLEESHEMAVIIKGSGYIETQDGEHEELVEGDVVYIEPMKKFRWNGDMDMIVPCGPAFNPEKHKLVEG